MNQSETKKEALIRRTLAKYACSYLGPSVLVARADEDSTLSVYWLAGQRIQQRKLSSKDSEVALLLEQLSVKSQQSFDDMNIINKIVKKYECSAVDKNLPFPPNLRSYHAVQLAYVYNHYRLSLSQLRDIEEIAKKMIEEFSRTHIVDEKYLHNIVPLAMLRNVELLHQLFSAMVNKIRSEALFSEEKICALTMMLQYADKNQLIANDIMEALSIVAERLDNIKVNDPSMLSRGLGSLNALLDAAMTVNVVDVDEDQLINVTQCLEKLSKTSDPYHAVAVEYARQALLRVTEQKTDWDQGLSASYELVNGVVQLGFAILDKSPGDIINSVISIYGAMQDIQGAMKESQHSWFLHVRTLKLMAQYDAKKFFAYLCDLVKEQNQQSSRFSSNAFPKEFVISLIEILDRMVRDKTMTELISVSVKGGERLLPAREVAVDYYAKIFVHPELYGNDRSVRELLLQKLYDACSIPEPMLQRTAKSAAQRVFGYAESRKKEMLGFWNNDFSLVSTYWGTNALIGLQAVDPNFSYPREAPTLTNDYVAEAVRLRYSLFYAIEGMRYDSYQTLRNTALKQDLETYIPVNATQSGEKNKLFDLHQSVRHFLNTEERVLLIHGNAGSGKSLFGRYLQHALWNEYQHGVAWVPIFVSLPSLKDPIRNAIRGTLLNEGFSDSEVRQLKHDRTKLLFILDGFDEIQAKDNLYRSNKFDEWECKVLITARTEYLLSLGDYYHYFADSSVTNLREYYIRPFDQRQRQSFFAKMISKGLTWFKSIKDYEDAIAKISGLNELITTPFMLRIIVDILPTLEKEEDKTKKVTRALVYESFTERELEANKYKLRLLTDQIVIPKKFDEVLSFRKFSMDLAVNMFIRKINSVMDKGDDYRFAREVEDYWDQFFGNHSPTLIASRYGAPLICVGRNQTFRHKSLLEYFAAKMLVAELQLLQQEEIGSINQSSFLNQRLVHEEPSVLDFMKDMLEAAPELEKELWKILEQSKSQQDIAMAAGNALTILVTLGRSFEGRDLSGIHSRGAKVDEGNFKYTNFQAAHFADTSWDGACLNEANFTDVIFEHNLIEERAAMVMPAWGIIEKFWVLDEKELIIVNALGNIFIWYDNQWKLSFLEWAFRVLHISHDQEWVVFRETRRAHLFRTRDLQAGNLQPKKVWDDLDPDWLMVFEDGFILFKDQTTLYRVDIKNLDCAQKIELKTRREIRELQVFLSTESAGDLIYYKDDLGWEKIAKIELNSQKLTLIKELKVSELSNFSCQGLRYHFMVKNGQGFLEVRSMETLTLVDIPLLRNRFIDGYVVSKTGRYLLTKSQKRVDVFALVQSEKQISVLFLDEFNGVTGSLQAQQLDDAEQYYALPFDGFIKLIKFQDSKTLQLIKIQEAGEILSLKFAKEETEKTLLIQQANTYQLLCRRIELDDLCEEHHQKMSAKDMPELSAFGAFFYGAQGLNAADYRHGSNAVNTRLIVRVLLKNSRRSKITLCFHVYLIK